MNIEESFDDFFNENIAMTVTKKNHGRFIEFEIADEMGEYLKFKLGYNDIHLLESFLNSVKKY